MQLLRVVAHTEWGVNQQALLKVYRTFIRSKLDYGCMIYGSARKSYLKPLNIIHHKALRLVLGAFQKPLCRTQQKPTKSKKRKTRYTILTKTQDTHPSNSTYDCTTNPKPQNIFNLKENTIKTFGLQMEVWFQDLFLALTRKLGRRLSTNL